METSTRDPGGEVSKFPQELTVSIEPIMSVYEKGDLLGAECGEYMCGYMCGEAGQGLTVSSDCNLHRWDQIAKNTSGGGEGFLVGLGYPEVATA